MTYRRYPSLYDRLVANVREESIESLESCWNWKRKRNNKGYPQLNIWKFGRTKTIYAHRKMYELFYGSIIPGYEVDHLCDNPSCINPNHLQAVPGKVNLKYRRRR